MVTAQHGGGPSHHDRDRDGQCRTHLDHDPQLHGAGVDDNGFDSPVDMGGVWNIVKGGATVPLKFEVFAGTTELTNISVVDTFTVKGVACPTERLCRG